MVTWVVSAVEILAATVVTEAVRNFVRELEIVEETALASAFARDVLAKQVSAPPLSLRSEACGLGLGLDSVVGAWLWVPTGVLL